LEGAPNLYKVFLARREIKAGLLLLGMLVLILTVNVEAQSCADSQIIMKISSETNAHGEVWDGEGDYGVDVCFNEIFGEDGGGTRDCVGDGSNRLLKLNSNTNAHGELKDQSSYSVDICYGGLVCRTSIGSCGEGEGEEMVRLSSDTNAHFEKRGGENYNNVVCCKLEGKVITSDPKCRDGIDNDGDGKIDFPDDIGCEDGEDDDESNQELGVKKVLWTDKEDNVLGVDAKVSVGQRVQLVASGVREGSDVMFRIFDRDGGIDKEEGEGNDDELFSGTRDSVGTLAIFIWDIGEAE
jgi:hypothetical protein